MRNITQETILNWFSARISSTIQLPIGIEPITGNPLEPAVTMDTFNLLLQAFWHKIQYGLVIRDLDNILILITTIRFIALVVRYNVYSSFLITLTSTVAAYLWYRHFLQTLFGYTRFIDVSLTSFRTIVADINRVRMEAGIYRVNQDIKTPLQLLKYTWWTGFVSYSSETKYYIDPISMFLARGKDLFFVPSRVCEFIYYTMVRFIIPNAILIITALYRELGSFAAYTTLTRMGKKYCPYLIRWHWTMLIMTNLVESYSYRFLYRMWYLKDAVLIQQHEEFMETLREVNIVEYLNRMQYIREGDFYLVNPAYRDAYIVNYCMHALIFLHLAWMFYVLLHAVSGQYFYVPGFTDNVELSIGRRDTNSIYSGGQTSWQDQVERDGDLTRRFPKIWYGWFGRGTRDKKNIFTWLYIVIIAGLKLLIKLVRLERPLKTLRKKLKKIKNQVFKSNKKKKGKKKK